MSKRRFTKRFVKRFIKEISYIRANELPYNAFYDPELDSISILLDVFLKGLWEQWQDANWSKLVGFLILNLNRVFLHEFIHEQSEPADGTSIWDFPRNMSNKEQARIVEICVEATVEVLCGQRVYATEYVMGRLFRLTCLNLNGCENQECKRCTISKWCKEDETLS